MRVYSVALVCLAPAYVLLCLCAHASRHGWYRSAAASSRLPKGKLRVLAFVRCDEFQHRRLAAVDRGEAALQCRDDLLWIGDALTVGAHGLGDLRKPAGEPFHIIFL